MAGTASYRSQRNFCVAGSVRSVARWKQVQLRSRLTCNDSRAAVPRTESSGTGARVVPKAECEAYGASRQASASRSSTARLTASVWRACSDSHSK